MQASSKCGRTGGGWAKLAQDQSKPAFMTSAPTSSRSKKRMTGNVRGILWMLFTGVLFVAFTGIIRYLGSDMHPVQAAFIRYAIGMVLIVPIFLRVGIVGQPFSRIKLHIFRGLIHGLGVYLWFYAITRIPIAEVTALGFTAPIFTTIGAALFLSEKLHVRRVAAVLFGFAGAIVILRPGIQVVDPGAMAQIAAAPLFAASFIIAKRLTETESSSAIVAFLSIAVTLMLLPPALAVWRTPTWEELFWLFIAAIIATVAHMGLTQAFRNAELTVIQPVAFVQLVWATLLGLYAFGEEPDLWTWIGGAIIVGSATYIAHRETRGSRRRDADEPAPAE